MHEVLDLGRQVALSKLTVLVTGETGVGKERLAEFIHQNSERRDKPEVRINCGAIPETMIEAEFFGFERGSFTGAIRSTRGKFELADGGTLFLDEIGELSLAMQVKLLRVLDEQRFYRLGAAQPCQVDVRVIAITNRDLAQDVMAGRFREDLFYRLNVVTIRIPPLRERPEDIPPLVDRLIAEFCSRTNLPQKKLALEGYDLLYSYPWRGNVRELRNVIERSVVVSRASYITGEDLIRAVPDLSTARTSLMRPVPKPLAPARSNPGRQREQGVLDLIRRRPDIGLQEILKEVGASKSTGIRLVNELIARGQVVRRERGKRSRYRIADGVPES
jgi:transcriptional regulator with PAS, ATPase and Fis domain